VNFRRSEKRKGLLRLKPVKRNREQGILATGRGEVVRWFNSNTMVIHERYSIPC
jgi:hypothetical protein